MRYIVVFLILANLAFFGWNYRYPLPESPAVPAQPLINSGLTLVSEFEEQTGFAALEARGDGGPELGVLPEDGHASQCTHLLARPYPARSGAPLHRHGVYSAFRSAQAAVDVLFGDQP